jgi:hypothetical protein
MSFTFSADHLTVGGGTIFMYDEGEYLSNISSERNQFNDIIMQTIVSKYSDRVRISRINITVPGINTNISILIDDSYNVTSLLVNDDNIISEIEPLKLTIVGNSLLPDVRLSRERGPAVRTGSLQIAGAPMFAPVRTLLRSVIDNRIGEGTIATIASKLLGHGPPSVEHMTRIGADAGKIVSKSIENLIRNNPKTLRRLNALLLGSWLPSLLRSLNLYFKSVLSSTLYIGPARARSERYYRYQDLAVSEIDPDGKNFPMFLNSLTSRQIDDFSSWVERLFGYGVRVARQTGHISINLVNGGVHTNIVDVGYGVSQILPVLGQIWWAKARPLTKEERSSPVGLLAIEQPELHLHPAHQALLADALVGETTPSEERRRMNYVVETHSETLINRFGEFISLGKIRPDDVQIILFDALTDQSTQVRTVGFSEDGTLLDWPYGFFQPSAL